MKKDKARTMQKLVAAVGSVIRKHGFGALGVNSVASEAGVDKVLVYRYFGSMEGLLREYVSASDYYKSATTMIPPSMSGSTARDIHTAGSGIILEQLRRLRASPDLQEIYRYELNTDDPVTRSLAEQRERAGTAIMAKFEEHIDRSRADLSAIVAVILAGGIYLTLRKKSARMFNGVSLENEEGWQRIEGAIDTMLGLVAETCVVPSPKAGKGRAGSRTAPRDRKPPRRSAGGVRKRSGTT
jgi:AcrR family transcriptional regulator